MAQGKKWSEDDDKALVAAWIRASENNIRGADQKTIEFWDAVYAHFQAQNRPARSRKAIRNRWSTIRHDVSKFVGVFSQAERNARSGSSPDDVVATAIAVYKERHGSDFELMHCWQALRACPKFSTPKRKEPDDEKIEKVRIGQKKAKQIEVEKVQRTRELKRLDRIASALEKRNKIMQLQILVLL
ncbi:hypothetical protein Ae201684P_011861 [Aphanomyces euteiches]|uniref:Myb-like domain-containing protein n=1 Tax=Aphanomyces euteiches TaxID=100861 RepID=A0A6G0WUA4_9STRA|nr:hypothetical protein Ae201684_011587 [Aphanomyces euteiches]KAH9097135.1 hypothetical protein Ae201684P_011861 [Aphanomyces euteiches]KAH9139017.1 hypothetical protein AeRB84_016704 [Aphanomyces euteiches]